MSQKEFFLFSIIVFLTILAWLIADIIHASTSKKIQSKIEISKPINYQIDIKIFESLKRRTP